MVAIASILDQNDFSYFLPTSYPDASNQFRVNWPFSSREEAKIDFQDGHHDLGFPIRMILAIFDLQVTPMLPIFQVNWPFG